MLSVNNGAEVSLSELSLTVFLVCECETKTMIIKKMYLARSHLL
jgi:hypothetical protein